MENKVTKVFNKDTGIVAVAEMTSAGVTAAGTVERLLNLFPNAVNSFKAFIARRVVDPYLETAEERFEHLLHDRYIDRGKAVGEKRTEESYKQLSREERVGHVTDIITKEGADFIAETGITLATESMLKRVWHAKIEPTKIMMVGTSVQLGTILSMGLLSKPVDKMYHALAELLPKVSGLERKKAEEVVRHAVYVGMSGALGIAAELALAQREHRGGHK